MESSTTVTRDDIDLAYVYKQMTSEDHAFTPDPKKQLSESFCKTHIQKFRIVSIGLN